MTARLALGVLVVGLICVTPASAATVSLAFPSLSSKGTNAVRRAGRLAVQLIVDTGTRRRVTRFSLHTSL